MEAITDYKLIDFLSLENQIIDDYLPILELLSPVAEVDDPISETFGKLKIPSVRSLKWGKVVTLKHLLSEGTTEAIIEAVSIITKLPKESVYHFTIIPFYSIYNGMLAQLIEINNMEVNELYSEDEDVVMIEAQANERMAKYGVINTIDSLAGGDITKWAEIEELPYMVVFTKLRMEKTRGDIKRDVKAIQERKNK